MSTRAAATFVLIGHPVGHSISPAIHQAAYEALGLSSNRYVCVDCPDEEAVRAQLESLRRGEIAGANVTVPHKRLALALADRVDGAAREVGAANVLVPERIGGERLCRVAAYNTDVGALADELSAGCAAPRSALVIGSGGAALAAVAACRMLGTGEIHVTARRWRKDVPSAAWPRAHELIALGARPLCWPSPPTSTWEAVVARVDLIVQATSAGMQGADPGVDVSTIIPWQRVGSRAFAYDVVYNPPSTPFLSRARERGMNARGGLGMLVGQAARAIELWLGVEAPLVAMRRAAERALFGANGG